VVVPLVVVFFVFSSIVAWQKNHPGRPMSDMFSFGGREAAHAPLIGTGGGGGGAIPNSRYM